MINGHNLNFRTQIFFGTSVRENGTEFGVLQCRFSKYHETTIEFKTVYLCKLG